MVHFYSHFVANEYANSVYLNIVFVVLNFYSIVPIELWNFATYITKYSNSVLRESF